MDSPGFDINLQEIVGLDLERLVVLKEECALAFNKEVERSIYTEMSASDVMEELERLQCIFNRLDEAIKMMRFE